MTRINPPEQTDLQKRGQIIWTVAKNRANNKNWGIYYLFPDSLELFGVSKDVMDSFWHYKKDAVAVANAELPICFPDKQVVFISEQGFFDEYRERQQRYKEYWRKLSAAQNAAKQEWQRDQTDYQRYEQVVYSFIPVSFTSIIICYAYPLDLDTKTVSYDVDENTPDWINREQKLFSETAIAMQYAQTNFRYMGNDPIELAPKQFQAELATRRRAHELHIKKARF